jgi:hypothetical protein
MRSFGFGKFCLVSVGMLLIVTLSFDLFRWLYRLIFGDTVPSALIFLLIGLSLFACLISFIYRYTYEGHSTDQRPMLYLEVSTKLEMAGFVGFFCALVLIWYIGSQWWGWAWIAIYFLGDIRIRSTAEKRLFAERLKEAKVWYPEMTSAEQTAKATAWVRGGIGPTEEYEQKRLKAN